MIPYITYFLTKHNIDFNLYVVDIEEDLPFNRGIALNIGFDFVKNICDYVCFHDIDMLPVKCDYSYDDEDTPIHLATGCSQYGYKPLSPNYYGGINLFKNSVFTKVNGFSNDYWLWGCEDNDLLSRVKSCGYELKRRDSIHECFAHKRDQSHFKSNKELYSRKDDISGLSTLKYTLLDLRIRMLYTELKVRYDTTTYQL